MGGFLGILSMGFFRREYCSGLPFPSLEDLPTQGSNPRLLHWQVGSLPLSLQGSPSRGVGGCTHLLLYSPETPVQVESWGRCAFSDHWAKGGLELSLILPLPGNTKSKIHLLMSNNMDFFFFSFFFYRRGYAHGKGKFILKICFLFSERGRKKETGKERKEKIRRMEMRFPFCLVNCGFTALPWTQLQRGRNQFFSIIPEWEKKTDL